MCLQIAYNLKPSIALKKPLSFPTQHSYLCHAILRINNDHFLDNTILSVFVTKTKYFCKVGINWTHLFPQK
jgi:hypothetical protein